MALTDRLRSSWHALTRAAVIPPWPPGVDNFWPYANLAQGYTFPLLQTSQPSTPQEMPDGTFLSYVESGYKADPIIFACVQARTSLFSEARFQWRRVRGGTVGELFGTADLALLEHPSAGQTTGDLLTRSLIDADLGGNAFLIRRSGGIHRARPDWVTIVLGTQARTDGDYRDVDATVLAFVYYPGGKNSGSGLEPEVYLPEEVAHFAPVKDPTAGFRGMSILTPIVAEVMGDKAASAHKLKFFENAATANLMVKSENIKDLATFEQFVDKIEEKHRGVSNAYKTMYLMSGMDAKVLGADMVQMDFKAVQGAGETRIAAAFGVPPVIAGFSEGLQGSSLNTGNYSAARRRFSDLTIRPLWRNFCGSLESILPPPAGAQLWYDDRDIAFLREDAKDRAEIAQVQAATIRQLVDGGFVPDSIVKAVLAEDYSLLKHSDLFSVQLQPPQPDGPPPEPTNGKTTIPSEVASP